MPNQFVVAFNQLIAVQTSVLGGAILATVGSVAANKPALLSEVDAHTEFIEGGMGETGGFTLEMLITDFSGVPTVGTAVTCNGSATGKTLHVIRDPKIVNGATYQIAVGDLSTDG
jgi:hypothetical protein